MSPKERKPALKKIPAKIVFPATSAQKTGAGSAGKILKKKSRTLRLNILIPDAGWKVRKGILLQLVEITAALILFFGRHL